MIARRVGDTGSKEPALLYLPGIDGTGELLLETAERLSRRFRVVRLAYEIGSDAPAPGSGYPELARSVSERIEEGGIQRALVLAESFGVGVALELALDHPERVAALALVNGFAHFERRFHLLASRAVARVAPDALFALGRRLGARRMLFAPRRAARERELFRAVSRHAFGPGYRARLAMIGRLDLRARLSEIRCPVALFASDRDRIVPAVRAAREMQRLLPDVTLEILPRAGHVVLPLEEEPWPERMLALAGREGFPAATARTPPAS